MTSTACSEACLALYLHGKPFSAPRALAAHVTAPLSSGRAARSRRKSQLLFFPFGSVARLRGIPNGHKQIGMARTTCSLVSFQPFQPGRNKTHPESFVPDTYVGHTLDNRFVVSRQSIGSYSNRRPIVACDRYRLAHSLICCSANNQYLS